MLVKLQEIGTLIETFKAALLAKIIEPLSTKKKIAVIREALGTNFCRRCNYCAPCTAGINISGVFLFDGYLSRYGLAGWAKERYAGLAKKASDCVECGICEERCPYQLPIRSMLKTCAEHFGE